MTDKVRTVEQIEQAINQSYLNGWRHTLRWVIGCSLNIPVRNKAIRNNEW